MLSEVNSISSIRVSKEKKHQSVAIFELKSPPPAATKEYKNKRVQPCITILHNIDEVIKRHIKPHHVYIGSHLAYFFFNYVFNGENQI